MERKMYSKEFKIAVAKEAMLPENERAVNVLADKYNVMPWTIERWKKLYQEEGAAAFSKDAWKKRESQRMKALEKENEALKEEVEILKKAAAFLASVKRD
ncbi:transposase [Clostridiales Family XIII bacterium PM5-7]